MKPFVFAIISLFILVPILCLIPIGMTMKRKLSLISISFLLSLVGLLSITFLELWQSSLVLLALVILSTFILEKRFGDSFNSQKSNVSNNELAPNLIGFSEMDRDLQKKQDLIKPKEISLIKEDKLLEKKDEKFKKIEFLTEEGKQKTSLNESVQNNDFLEIDEDISFLHNREDIFITEETINNDVADKSKEKEHEVGYMSEIEKLLEENDMESEENTGYTRIEDVKEMENLEEIVNLKNNLETEIAEVEVPISDVDVEIEELVFQK